MNSRSQTKIRKIQQINLLAEERYLKTKGLLYEGPQEDVLKCFTDNGVEESLIPDSCNPQGVGQKFDITACAAALPGVITSVPEDKQEALKTCLMNLVTMNVDFGDIQNTINKGIKMGTDILKGTGIGIKF
jgi:hypothetical protein